MLLDMIMCFIAVLDYSRVYIFDRFLPLLWQLFYTQLKIMSCKFCMVYPLAISQCPWNVLNSSHDIMTFQVISCGISWTRNPRNLRNWRIFCLRQQGEGPGRGLLHRWNFEQFVREWWEGSSDSYSRNVRNGRQAWVHGNFLWELKFSTMMFLGTLFWTRPFDRHW